MLVAFRLAVVHGKVGNYPLLLCYLAARRNVIRNVGVSFCVIHGEATGEDGGTTYSQACRLSMGQ